jgi:hypothetical protein
MIWDTPETGRRSKGFAQKLKWALIERPYSRTAQTVGAVYEAVNELVTNCRGGL